MSIKNNFPPIKPNLLLDFKNSKNVDSGVLFQRSALATYTDSDGYLNYAPQGTPRFDHDPVTKECRGLLLEKAATQRCTNFTEFTLVRGSVSKNYTGPDRISNSAFSYVPDATNGQHALYKNIGDAGSGTDLAYSVFIKKGNSRYVHFHFGDYAGIVFDFDTATVVATKASDSYAGFVDYKIVTYSDGWYRLVIYGANSGSGADSYIQIDAKQDYTGTNAYTFTGDGSTAAFYLFGPQAEWTLNETSYIPSQTGTATRSSDYALIREENLNWINTSAMTLHVELESSFADRLTYNNYMISTSNGTDRYLYANSSNGNNRKTSTVVYAYYDGNTNSGVYGTGDGSSFKMVARITPTNYDTCVNGPDTIRVSVTNRSHNGDLLNPANIQIQAACYSKIAFYPGTFTNDQMVSLIK